jgi:hypothetical protein
MVVSSYPEITVTKAITKTRYYIVSSYTAILFILSVLYLTFLICRKLCLKIGANVEHFIYLRQWRSAMAANFP